MSATAPATRRPRDEGLRLLLGTLLVLALVGAALGGAYTAYSAHEDTGTGEFSGLGLALGLYVTAFCLVNALVVGTTLWAVRARTGPSTAVAALVTGGTLVGLIAAGLLSSPGDLLVAPIWLVPGFCLAVVLVRWRTVLRDRHGAESPEPSPR